MQLSSVRRAISAITTSLIRLKWMVDGLKVDEVVVDAVVVDVVLEAVTTAAQATVVKETIAPRGTSLLVSLPGSQL